MTDDPKTQRRKAAAKKNLDASAKRQAEFVARRERILDTKSFNDAIGTLDDLRAVILGATYIDYLLTYLIDRYLFAPGDLYSETEPSFAMKIGFATALGEIGYQERPLFDGLRWLRNKFAHELAEKILPEHVVAIRHRLSGSAMKDYAQAWYDAALVAPLVKAGHLTADQFFVRDAFERAYKFLYGQIEKPPLSREERIAEYSERLTKLLLDSVDKDVDGRS